MVGVGYPLLDLLPCLLHQPHQRVDDAGVTHDLGPALGPVEAAPPKAHDLAIEGDFREGGFLRATYNYEGEDYRARRAMKLSHLDGVSFTW